MTPSGVAAGGRHLDAHQRLVRAVHLGAQAGGERHGRAERGAERCRRRPRRAVVHADRDRRGRLRVGARELRLDALRRDRIRRLDLVDHLGWLRRDAGLEPSRGSRRDVRMTGTLHAPSRSASAAA